MPNSVFSFMQVILLAPGASLSQRNTCRHCIKIHVQTPIQLFDAEPQPSGDTMLQYLPHWWLATSSPSTAVLKGYTAFLSGSGHVSWPPASMLYPLLSYMLVSRYSGSFKATNIFLRTCPLSMHSLYFVTVNLVRLLLYLAGDVELNSGPSAEELLSEILSNQMQVA